MQLIKIQYFTTPNKESYLDHQQKYKLVLGNGHQELFTNKRQLQGYLSRTNQFLNDIFLQLNHLYIEGFSLFRESWLHFDKFEYQSLSIEIRQELFNIDKSMDLVPQRSKGINGAALTWKFLLNIIESLKAIFKALLAFFVYKGFGANKVKTKFYINQLDQFKINLIQYC